MNIAIASDHRGLELLEVVRSELHAQGHEVDAMGLTTGEVCDYPDQAGIVCKALRDGEADRGVLICGTGIGMCITANKFAGIRAALALDELSAQLSRSHNDANVLCLSGDLVGHALGRRIVKAWMQTDFEGGRHERRLEKIARIDSRIED
ncbi:MAG: ribose 5-phosphate isomerase B [Phycisphaerales bacterium]|jgi:ribose 5-phosphate isomerase B|nr:ribose 5-phosphate isomerase B [Phycisphaerales bacterium]